MPLYTTWNDEKEEVQRYDWPAKYMTPVDEMNDALRGWRKEAIKDRDVFVAYQKQFAQEDREAAKFFKDCANEQLKIQRAATLMLPALAVPDANQVPVHSVMWPIELSSALDDISRRLLLRFHYGVIV